MTIFDKLSGFAHKAKENATARAILAKDKRLENSLSEKLDPAHIGLLKMATYGLPSTISCIAFDPVASLLAVAGGSESNAYIRIFGRGVSANLSVQNHAKITHMQFKIGSPVLMTVDRKNVITTYDLRTKKPRGSISTPSAITCLEHCVGTDWVYVGYADGNVDVFDIDLGVFASYGIPDLILDEIQNDPKTPVINNDDRAGSQVIAIQMHPTDLNTVLIGYPAAVFMWSVREQTVKRIFVLDRTKYRGRLTCFAWNPCGNRFMAGYNDGYMHMWDIRSDHKPILSRKVFQACPTTSPADEHGEPISQLMWYFDDAARKSFLAIAGGASLPDIHGIHILEFAMDGDVRDARKQTILPTPVDISNFILLSSGPYYSGSKDPLGVAIIGSDGALRAYGIDHGYPELELPPALQFLDPPFSSAYHYTNITVDTFQRMTAPVNNGAPPRFLPLAGGAAGSGHVYRIPSNDILITVHERDIIRFWDASYTSLRPLPHLTISCRDQLNSANTHIQHITMDQSSSSIAVAFDNGSIHVYNLPLMCEDTQASEVLASGCNDTLDELSELLEDMQTPVENENAVENESDDSRSLAVQEESAEQTKSDGSGSEHSEPEVTESQNAEPTSDIHVKFMNQATSSAFSFKLQISLDSTAKFTQFRYITDELLAFANMDNKVYIVNTTTGHITFSLDTNGLINGPGTADKQETSEGNQNELKLTATITCINVYQTYDSKDYARTSPQVLIGFNDGRIYQVPMLNGDANQNAVVLPTVTSNDIIDLAVINLEGPIQRILDIEKLEQQKQKRSVQEEEKESATISEQDQQTPPRNLQDYTAKKGDDAASTKSEKSATSLLRKTTRKFSKSAKRRNSRDDEPPPMPTQVAEEPGEISQTKRNAGSKWDYQQQADPHLLIIASKTSVSAVLMGYNVRLFHTDVHAIEGETENEEIIRSKIMQTEGATCLVIVLNNGHVVAMSLPHLQPIARVELPQHVPLQSLSLSSDGRLLFMAGGLQLGQCIVLLQNSMPCGESVILHNPERVLPPHPSLANSSGQQRTKKTWLGAVQEAFQKGPVTISELDTIFGKITRVPHTEAGERTMDHRQAGEASAAKTSNSNQGAKMGNVFQELGNKMNERGEKLDQLQAKFEDMSHASGDFLKAVREYNERQAKKKWWEF